MEDFSAKLIGLSLSQCIKDMVQGKVEPEHVLYIIAGTKIEAPEHLNQVIASYRRNWWSDNPDKGEELCREFFNTGRVLQPRKEGAPIEYWPKPRPGCWLTALRYYPR